MLLQNTLRRLGKRRMRMQEPTARKRRLKVAEDHDRAPGPKGTADRMGCRGLESGDASDGPGSHADPRRLRQSRRDGQPRYVASDPLADALEFDRNRETGRQARHSWFY